MAEHSINSKEGKEEFINSMMESLRKSLTNKVSRMPDEWDGHELRLLIVDHVSENVACFTNKRSKRYREYVSTRYTKNI